MLKKIKKKWVAEGSNFIALAIIIGALSKHYLQISITEDCAKSIQTALIYMMVHSLALLFLSVIHIEFGGKMLEVIAVLFKMGIYLFSFSILLSNGIKIFSPEKTILIKKITYITPIGGICFIAGWLLLCLKMLRKS